MLTLRKALTAMQGYADYFSSLKLQSMITNTAKKPNFSWLFGGNPSAIEAQEAEGQAELVKSSQLPAKVNSPHGADILEKYKELGIEVLGKTDGDELFLNVKLPEGWAVQPTDHSMWSKLVDVDGNEIASIFYKAAFYDRDAFVNFIVA